MRSDQTPESSRMVREVHEVLARYKPIVGSVLDGTPVTGGFSGAGVWKLTADSGEFALRRWPTGGLPTARILGLHRLLSSLRNAGLHTVAVPLADANGERLVRHANLSWQLEPWLPGRADFHTRPAPARLTAAIRALAEWHAAANLFNPTPAESRWFSTGCAVSPAVEERLRLSLDWQAGPLEAVRTAAASDTDREFADLALMICRLAARAMPATIDQLQAMQRQTFRLQPCLRDVWHDHVLFVEDTVTGLIDPGACRTEHVCTDLARLLGSLVGDDTERWRQAVATYCQFRSLDDNELHLLAVLDRSAVVLSPLSWLQRRYIMHAAFDRNRVLPRLTGQLDRLRRIAD